MPPITDPGQLAELVALNRAIGVAAAIAHEAAASVNEADSRAVALRKALTEHDAAEPPATPDVASELSDLLAANPAAAVSADWTGRLRTAQDQQAALLVEWQGKRTIIAQALERVQTERTTREEQLEAAQRAHGARYADFVLAARRIMTDELRRRWETFYREVMGPLDALRNARHLYRPTEPIHTDHEQWMVDLESSLAIRRFLPPTEFNLQPVERVTLYPRADATTAATMLAAFRNSLAAVATDDA